MVIMRMNRPDLYIPNMVIRCIINNGKQDTVITFSLFPYKFPNTFHCLLGPFRFKVLIYCRIIEPVYIGGNTILKLYLP